MSSPVGRAALAWRISYEAQFRCAIRHRDAVMSQAVNDRWWYGSDWQTLGPVDRARKAARSARLFGVAP